MLFFNSKKKRKASLALSGLVRRVHGCCCADSQAWIGCRRPIKAKWSRACGGKIMWKKQKRKLERDPDKRLRQERSTEEMCVCVCGGEGGSVLSSVVTCQEWLKRWIPREPAGSSHQVRRRGKLIRHEVEFNVTHMNATVTASRSDLRYIAARERDERERDCLVSLPNWMTVFVF